MARLIRLLCAVCRVAGVFIGERVCPECVSANRVTPDHLEPEDHDD